jgi:hypothetical protein
MVPSPNLWKSQMFRQVLDFFRVRIRGSGSGGIVIFHWIRQSTNCKKPTVSLLNFLSDETTMKTLKNHWNSPCANEPLPDFSNLRKNTCRYFFRSGFMISWTSQSHWKIWGKLPNAGEPMPDFLRMLENTYRIFPVWESQKVHWGWKKISPFLEKNVYNRTARYMVYVCRPTCKNEWKILNPQTGLTGTFDFIWEKSYNFYFSVAVVDSSEFIYQWEEPMKREWWT